MIGVVRMNWVIDLMLLAVLVLCAWTGYRKGIIMEVGAVVCLIISLYGAYFVANTFSYEVVSAVKPFAGGFIETVIADEVPERLDYDFSEYSMNDIVQAEPEKAYSIAKETFLCLGVFEPTAEEMADRVTVYADENQVGLRNAIIDVTCNTLVFAATVALCFMVILIFLTFIGNMPNLTFRLPNMEEVDEIGGAIVGVLRGAVLCMLVAWVLKFSGMFIGEDTLSMTLLGKLFAKIGLIPFFLGI